MFIIISFILDKKKSNSNNEKEIKIEQTENLGLTEIQKKEILNLIYPVGSYYISAENKYPENFLIGDWELIKDRFLIGAGEKYEVNSIGVKKSIY